MKSVLHKVAALTVVSLQMLIAACSSPRFTMFETEKENITSAVLITDVLAVEDIIGDTDRVILQTNQRFADRAVKEVSKILEAKGYPITKIYPAQIGYFGKHKFYRVAEKSIDRDDNETLPIQQTPLTPDTLLLDKTTQTLRPSINISNARVSVMKPMHSPPLHKKEMLTPCFF